MMNLSSTIKDCEFAQLQNFSIFETLISQPHDVCDYNPSPQIWAFIVLVVLLLETVGNFLLFCLITFEKFGMDSQKRTVTNQLLSSICVIMIALNMFMTLLSINFGIGSKIYFYIM